MLVFELSTYLELFKELNKKKLQFEDKTTHEFSTMKCHINSIKGIGIITIASILIEIVTIEKFDSPGLLCAFTGIEPLKNQIETHYVGEKS